MITYPSDVFGLKTLFVWHGSAVFGAFLPASFSTGMLVVYLHFLRDYFEETNVITHPYAIQVFIVILGFLLVFRLNYSYHRVRISFDRVLHRCSNSTKCRK
jgi:predicted membrane chloride channel (bestrophin family)